ncbi:MAG: hypothetical protein NT124_04715 [Candidatus Dependentiae bacterium]|nr:hypothetical protein [Candidatus Dependentiae bacterium]
MNNKNKDIDRLDHMKNQDLQPRVIEKHEGRRLRDYWRNLMNSAHNKISSGAAHVFQSLRGAHREGWKHRQDKKK